MAQPGLAATPSLLALASQSSSICRLTLCYLSGLQPQLDQAADGFGAGQRITTTMRAVAAANATRR
jgi:hypothetical protein